MESVKPTEGDPNEERASGPAGVPRRFGVGTLLLITACYAGLFSFLRSTGGPPAILIIVAMFVTLIGIGQALLFKGKRPRTASVLVGSFSCALAMAVQSVVIFARDPGFPIDFIPRLLWVFHCALLWGGVLGYVTGALIGGVFLIIRWIRRPIRPR